MLQGLERGNGTGRGFLGHAEFATGQPCRFGIAAVVRAHELHIRETVRFRIMDFPRLDSVLPGKLIHAVLQHSEIRLRLVGKQAHLGADVLVHVLMEVEMVLADVQQDAHARVQRRTGLQLETGQFQHHYIRLLAGQDIFGQRRADIAARKHRKPLFLQHGRAQAGCRGLAAGPGHAEHRLAGKLAPCQFGFGHDFRRGAVGQKFADDRSGHTGARHDQLRIPELARGMFAAYDFHSRGLRPFREISRDAIQRAIQQPHPRTKLVQQFGGGHAGNPGSHNNREVARFHRRCRLREHFVCSFHHDSRMMPPAARGTAP